MKFFRTGSNSTHALRTAGVAFHQFVFTLWNVKIYIIFLYINTHFHFILVSVTMFQKAMVFCQTDWIKFSFELEYSHVDEVRL